jgi:hypothetical protein
LKKSSRRVNGALGLRTFSDGDSAIANDPGLKNPGTSSGGAPQRPILIRRQPQVATPSAALYPVLENLSALRITPCFPTPRQLPGFLGVCERQPSSQGGSSGQLPDKRRSSPCGRRIACSTVTGPVVSGHAQSIGEYMGRWPRGPGGVSVRYCPYRQLAFSVPRWPCERTNSVTEFATEPWRTILGFWCGDPFTRHRQSLPVVVIRAVYFAGCA